MENFFLYLPSFVLIFAVIRWSDGNDGDEEDDVGDQPEDDEMPILGGESHEQASQGERESSASKHQSPVCVEKSL